MAKNYISVDVLDFGVLLPNPTYFFLKFEQINEIPAPVAFSRI
jgi:hypothetical protein